MKASLLEIQTDREAFTVQRIALNLTTLGLYEGISDYNIRENLDFQGHPFGRMPLPILFHGLDSAVNLADKVCIWALLEGPPKDSMFSFSSLAFCLVSDSLTNPLCQLQKILTTLDYFELSKDFDL